MAGEGAPAVEPDTGAVADGSDVGRRRTWLRRTAVAVIGAIGLTMCATRGLSPWEVEARVAGAVRAHPDSTNRELARVIGKEFTDDAAQHSGSDGAPFSPVSDSGISGTPIVRRLASDGTVRVALVYAEAPFIPTGYGDVYCLVVDVPVEGASHRRMVEADFSRPDHCAHAHAEVAQG